MTRMTRWFSVGSIAAFAAVALCATAMAATINGSARSEFLKGTNGPDTINGHRGNDRIVGKAANDLLNGNRGNDRIFGGPGNDTSSGGLGNDRMSGGDGDDTQNGGPGNDVIFANRGVDTSNGGPGNDTLWALAKADVPNPGVDTLNGEDGNDTFRARDGEADLINCGAGNDNAILDVQDVIVDATPSNPNGSCERVVRKAPKAKEDSSETKGQSAPSH